MSAHLPRAIPPQSLQSRTPAARWQALAIIAIALLGLSISRVRSEIIPVSDGLGWDGQRYAYIVQDVRGSISTQTDYHIHRIAPSLALAVVMRTLGIPRDRPHIIWAFQVLAVMLLAIAGATWMWLARHFSLGATGTWIGFIGLFINFACLKQAFYYPTLTDLSAFTIGLVAFALFVAGRQYLLLLVTLFGAFSWPTLGLSCAMLLLFPYRGVETSPATETRSRWFATGVAVAVTAVLIIRLAMLYVDGVRQVGLGPLTPIDERFIIVSTLLYALLVFVAMRTLLGPTGLSDIRAALASLRAKPVILATLAIVVPMLIIAGIAATLGPLPESSMDRMTMLKFLDFLAVLPVSRPLTTLVGHFAYFGPVVVLLCIYWPRVCEIVRTVGPGLLLFAGLNLLIAFGPESRQSMPAFPVFVALLAITLDRRPWRPLALWGFAALSLFFSKVWLPINERVGDTRVFLEDRYFMNHGPYIPARGYILHAAALVMVFGIVYAARRLGLVDRRKADAPGNPLSPAIDHA